MAEFDDKVVIVTGGGNGIGQAAARMFATRGAHVVIADIDDGAAARIADDIRAAGGQALAVQHDVRDATSCTSLAERVTAELGTIDVLVNNAGVGPHPQPFHQLTEQEYDRVMNVNAKGVFLTTRAVAPVMMEKRYGRIVNLSSVVGKKASPFVLPYDMSKWAVIGLTQCVARELAPLGITVNAVCPGVIKTPLHEGVISDLSAMNATSEDATWQAFLDRIPMGRLQEGDDIAEMILFLASDRARNVTGSSFNVNGGMELN